MANFTYIVGRGGWPIGNVLVPEGLVVVPGATGNPPSLQVPFPDPYDYIDSLNLLSRGPPFSAQALDTPTYQAQVAAWLACGSPPLLMPLPPAPAPSSYD